MHLLDGDRIAILLASYITELLKACGTHLRLGLVQTAYANGASTRYITEDLVRFLFDILKLGKFNDFAKATYCIK